MPSANVLNVPDCIRIEWNRAYPVLTVSVSNPVLWGWLRLDMDPIELHQSIVAGNWAKTPFERFIKYDEYAAVNAWLATVK